MRSTLGVLALVAVALTGLWPRTWTRQRGRFRSTATGRVSKV